MNIYWWSRYRSQSSINRFIKINCFDSSLFFFKHFFLLNTTDGPGYNFLFASKKMLLKCTTNFVIANTISFIVLYHRVSSNYRQFYYIGTLSICSIFILPNISKMPDNFISKMHYFTHRYFWIPPFSYPSRFLRWLNQTSAFVE